MNLAPLEVQDTKKVSFEILVKYFIRAVLVCVGQLLKLAEVAMKLVSNISKSDLALDRIHILESLNDYVPIETSLIHCILPAELGKTSNQEVSLVGKQLRLKRLAFHNYA